MDSETVLTAAHCTIGKTPSSITVMAGATNKNQGQKISGEKVLYYKYTVATNDIAIIKLSKPLTLGNNVQAICLPDRGPLEYGTECYASGWGKTKTSEYNFKESFGSTLRN